MMGAIIIGRMMGAVLHGLVITAFSGGVNLVKVFLGGALGRLVGLPKLKPRPWCDCAQSAVGGLGVKTC